MGRPSKAQEAAETIRAIESVLTPIITRLQNEIEQMKAAADKAGYFFFGHVDGSYTLQQK
jgi:hypothetical protein